MIEADDDLEVEMPAALEEETKPAETEAEQTPEESEGEEITVTLGDAAPEPEEDTRAAAPWVRELRKANREKDKHIRELEKKLAAQTPVVQPQVLGPKPTLEGMNYDADKFEAALEQWHARKREADEEVSKQAAAAEKERAAWQEKVDGYNKAKSALKIRDYEEAEETVKELFSPNQQGMLLLGAEKPALMVYALGKNPKKARELAAITDPTKFAWNMGKLESSMKVTQQKTAPTPERRVSGGSSSAASAAIDNQLSKLREKAEKTGDYSDVMAYKRQLKARQG